MTPDLKPMLLMLETMHGDIRELRSDVGDTKVRLAGHEGARHMRHWFLEAGKWAVGIAVAFFAGHVGGGAH